MSKIARDHCYYVKSRKHDSEVDLHCSSCSLRVVQLRIWSECTSCNYQLGSTMTAVLSSCPRVVRGNQSFDTKCYAAARLSQKQACVATGASMQLQQRSSVCTSRPAVVEVVSFKFMKKLGVKKPGFLPDFGKVCSANAAIKRIGA